MTNEEARKRINNLKNSIFYEQMKDRNVDYAFIRKCEAEIKECEPYLMKHGYCIEHIITQEGWGHEPSYINHDLMHDEEPYLYETKEEALQVLKEYEYMVEHRNDGEIYKSFQPATSIKVLKV